MTAAPQAPGAPANGLPSAINLSGIYSSTGFDMLGVLARVVTRPNPVVNMGPIDFSCSFVVSDARKPDMPIVYVSETFERLTGYTNGEIVGRNCRFLQSPDGDVPPGTKRLYSDNNVIKNMKLSLNDLKECQFTLINYKKSGEPFINLVTMVPISWENPKEITFIVGFQVDLVDQPQTILNKMQDGSYLVNYTAAAHPVRGYDMRDADIAEFITEAADVMDPRNALAPIPPVASTKNVVIPQATTTTYTQPPKSSSPSGKITNLSTDGTLIETDADLVHLVSLRGLFLYVAPNATQRILEYTPEEIISHSISEFIHPADVPLVLRDLRSSTSGEAVQFCCRYKRKRSGWIYMDVRGHLYEGQSNRRTKCLVLTAREKIMGTLCVDNIIKPHYQPTYAATGDFAECFIKISAEGLILHSSFSESVVGIVPSVLYATHILEYIHSDDRGIVIHGLDIVKTSHHVVDVVVRFGLGPSNSYELLSVRLLPSDRYRMSHIFLQIRRAASNAQLGLQPTSEIYSVVSNSFDPKEDLFAPLDPVRPTSMAYELNELKIINRRMRDAIKELSGVDTPTDSTTSRESRKRKASSESSSTTQLNPFVF